MAMSFTTDSMKQLLVFPFQDQEWKNKFVVGFLVCAMGVFIIPLFFILGYGYEIQRRIIVDKKKPSLPNWDDWGILLNYGLRSFGVSFIYSIPTFLIYLIPLIFFIILPIFMAAFQMESDFFPFLFFLFMGFQMTVGMLVSFIFFLASVLANSHMIAKDDFSAAFKISEWWAIFRNNIGGYLISLIFLFGIYSIIYVVTMILMYSIVLCCINPIFTLISSFYLQILFHVLFAHAYLDGVENIALQNGS